MMTATYPLFTCYTCGLGFSEPQVQRDHYKTDLHRYNLKRKVACLPPVTAEDFDERARLQQAQTAKNHETVTLRCSACHKNFSCQNAYENHLLSKRHKVSIEKQNTSLGSTEKGGLDVSISEKNRTTTAVAGGIPNSVNQAVQNTKHDREDDDGDDSDGSWSSYDGDGLSIEECLFCPLTSLTMELNVDHMTVEHSFFIPDIEYLTDPEGLISYLGAKVGEGNMCLWCNEKGRHFQSTRAVQRHMVAKGHCKMLHEGDALAEYADFYDYTSSYPNEEDEDDEDDSSMTLLDSDEGYELVLPSGATIGHRSLLRYYRQNIIERRTTGNRKVLPSILSRYKSLGWTGTTGAMAVKKAADIKFMERARRRYDLNMRMKGNNQKHFRDPNGLIR